MNKYTFILALILLSVFSISANEYSRWSLTARGGVTNSFGDMITYEVIGVDYINEGYGGSLNFQATPILGFFAEYAYVHLVSEKSGLEVESKVNELTMNTTLSLTKLFFQKNTPEKINIYGYAGLGIAGYRMSQLRKSDNTYVQNIGYTLSGGSLENDDMEYAPVLPVGIGVDFKLSERLDLGALFTLRMLNRDNLDGQASGATNDVYGYSSVGLTYKLGAKKAPHLRWETNQAYMVEDKKEEQVAIDEVKKLNQEIENLKQANQDIHSMYQEMEVRATSIERKAEEAQQIQSRAKLDDKELANIKLENLSVFFYFNSRRITNNSLENVARVARVMNDHPGVKVEIIGYADQIGEENYNNKLSEIRAQSVKDELVNNYGISEDRIAVVPRGESDPLSKNLNKVNRRADFRVIME